MNDYSEHLLLDKPRKTSSHFSVWVTLVVPFAAILFQVYVPLFFQYLSYLELPLLVTVYFSLMRRQPVAGTFIGAGIGLVQDSLSHQPLGMFGIVKTLVGYFAGNVSMRFEVDNPVLRFILGFFFFFFHQFFYWVLTRALLGQQLGFDLAQTLTLGMLNALVALPLFHFLDKLKETS
ncbi:MAG: rod shape-determining protein MreD [Acidobacteriales bacterium]|nr:rod shape-determining protein MreD [Terriglobales bacterium]